MEAIICFVLGAAGMWWVMGQLGGLRSQVMQESNAIVEHLKKVTDLVNENEKHVTECLARMEKVEALLKS